MELNYEWEKIGEYGQFGTGFVDVFQAVVIGRRACVVINYLPQFEDGDRKVVTTVLLEGENRSWTKGQINNIAYDAEERIKEVANFKFNRTGPLFYMTFQTLFLESLDGLTFGNSGDFSFEEPLK